MVEGFGLSAGERMLRGCRAKVPEVEQCAPPPAALVPGCWTERLPCAKSEYTYVDELPVYITPPTSQKAPDEIELAWDTLSNTYVYRSLTAHAV